MKEGRSRSKGSAVRGWQVCTGGGKVNNRKSTAGRGRIGSAEKDGMKTETAR